MSDPNLIRLQKFLARNTTYGSRRSCEELIASGAVRVNGQTAHLGQVIDPERDRVEVDGRAVTAKRGSAYYLYNKPRGVLCTFSEEAGQTTLAEVVRRMKIPARVFSVGRLDADAEGLLLLTDDGELAERLTHPRYGVPRVYEVGLNRPLTPELAERVRRLKTLRPFVPPKVRRAAQGDARREAHMRQIRPQRISPPKILDGVGHRHLRILLREGRQREVKRIFAEVGLHVDYLRRTGFGSLRLKDLAPGHVRALSRQEVEELKAAPAAPTATAHPSRDSGRRR